MCIFTKSISITLKVSLSFKSFCFGCVSSHNNKKISAEILKQVDILLP